MKFRLHSSMFGKLVLFGAVLEVIMLIIVLFALYSFNLNERKQNLSKLEEIILESSVLRLEMLVRRDSNFTRLYKENYAKILVNMQEYSKLSSELCNISKVKELDSIKSIYSEAMTNYIVLIEKFGLNEDTGVEGDFRRKVHQIESTLNKHYNDEIFIKLLQARRREKDFIMRGRDEYYSQVVSIMNELIDVTQKSRLGNNQKNDIIQLAYDYKKSFTSFVSIYKQMAISEKTLLDLETMLKTQIKEIVLEETEMINNFQATLLPLFVFSIVISFILSVIIAKSITKPLVDLKYATIKIANGDLRIKVKIKSRDEIGDKAEFFNLMTERIAEANETILEQQSKLSHQFTELKAINATRDKFFSIIAHDLKNPISAFMCVSDFLVKEFPDLSPDEVREFLDEVNSSAKQLYELLENLLLWSRTQRGMINYHPTNLDLKAIIISNIELLKINADNKSIQLDYQMNRNCIVFADPNMLNTILRNLITNAIKFTYQGGKVIVDVIADEDECMITVSDTGVGIDDDSIDKLFKLESNVSTAGTSQESGTGLGLILCKEFVEKHSGKIWVSSKIGEGSNFHFTIPIAK